MCDDGRSGQMAIEQTLNRVYEHILTQRSIHFREVIISGENEYGKLSLKFSLPKLSTKLIPVATHRAAPSASFHGGQPGHGKECIAAIKKKSDRFWKAMTVWNQSMKGIIQRVLC
nr:hypothetical protein Iba_chr10dCG14550 [Ipomoea batatas]